ncbi:MAG: hypothetical protein ACRDZW_03180 [Acidimicrobiales bacterium]
MRSLLAALAVLAAASLGALILGEYELAGFTPIVAGLLFGLVLAEVAMAAAGRSTPPVAAGAAVAGALGLVWAAWISSGRDWSFVPTEAWVGVGLAAVSAAGWVRAGRGRAGGSRRSPR